MSAGADLESAIQSAAEHYTAAGRAELHKQRTPRAFAGAFIGKAPIDFRGWALTEIGTREPLWLEAKHTESSRLDFKAKGGIEPQQIDAMRDAVQRLIRMLLVVEFAPPIGEVYVVDGRRVVEFAAAPWRSSLSLDWFRSHGEVAKVSPLPHRRVWFLDTRPHRERFDAGLRVVQERAKCEGRIVELYPAPGVNQGSAATAFRELLATKPGRGSTEAERLVWLKRFSEWEMERNLREARKPANKRKPAKGKRGGWWSGGRR